MLVSRTIATAATALTIALSTSHAGAEEGEPEHDHAPDTEQPDRHDDILVTAGVGAFGDGDKTGGTLSLTGLRQRGWLGYGATFEYGGAVFDYTTVTAAPMVGLFLDSPRGLRLGLAAVGGIHTYDGVGRGFIGSSDPGASGTTAFLGARAFAGAEIGGKARFHIGLQLSAEDDLSRTRTPYTFQQTAFASGAGHPESASHTVGALRLGAMLALGTAFDL